MAQRLMETLGVSVKVADIARSRAFYDALGFKRVSDYGPETGAAVSYHGTFYEIGPSALIEISDAHELVPLAVCRAPIENAKVMLFIKVPSLIPVLDAAMVHNIALADEPRWFPWRAFEMTINDPDGLSIVFTSQDSHEDVEMLRKKTHGDLYRSHPDYSRE